ncbi:MAG: type II secretion system F family protein [Pirellulales bacterium]
MGKDRLPDEVLADLLGRLAIAVAAGVDLRRGCRSEADRVPSAWRPAVGMVADRLDRGDTLAEAMAAAGDAFPPLVRGMIRVGDHAGRLAEVLRDTAASLRQAVAFTRGLRRALLGPAVQLVVALVAVAVIGVASSMSIASHGEPLDLLGLGLGRSRSFAAVAVVACGGLAAVVVAGVCAMRSWRAGGWARVVGRRLPVIGGALQAAEAAAWCRAAALAAHVGASPGETVELASAAAPGMAVDRAAIETRLRRGDDLATALRLESRLPRAAVEAVAVGELTGTTAEALDRVADGLAAAACRGWTAAVQVAGFTAWGLVAALVAVVVIRVVTSYAGIIQDAARP